ncbi:MAG: DUF1343 domain-containing protein [Flavobacteriaceae bacterium]|nr:DUF1343 domain-containing protein [Flavobacteriaceae bacterium]
MRLSFFKNTLLIVLPLTMFLCFSCGSGSGKQDDSDKKQSELVIHETVEIQNEEKEIRIGANRYDVYLELLKGKKMGVVANQTSRMMVNIVHSNEGQKLKHLEMHLVDYLHENNAIKVEKVFSPEHGFRGKADAGEHVQDGIDKKTGIPILSLHGKSKKPTPTQMKGLDVVVFDIQDVGVRFYTYISTMHYVMEACAEAGIPFMVLDRPNPNGHYIDGPTMKKEHTSFLGMHPIPMVHGMTIGEYAQMINGEGWLSDGLKCDLTVITMENYTHDTFYSVPVRPSPNLPNDTAINLYPSLGLLEGTNLNAGRGTEMQFQLIGSPHLPKDKYTYAYTPQPNFGSKYPKHRDVECNGLDLREIPRMKRVDLTWIIDAYRNHEKKEDFFNTNNFTTHAGTEELQKQIEQGYTMREIRKTWLKDLEAFKKIRSKYLLYD